VEVRAVTLSGTLERRIVDLELALSEALDDNGELHLANRKLTQRVRELEARIERKDLRIAAMRREQR
jgi:regulator of replication initiation timing